MKKVLSFSLCAVLLLAACFITPNNTVVSAKTRTPMQIAPINRDSVIEKLVSEGKLSKNASQDEITAALRQYIGNVNANTSKSKYDKKREAVIEEKINTGFSEASVKGNKFGQAASLSPAQSIAYPTAKKTVKVLVLLGDFSDYQHNNIPKPDITRSYWTGDFSVNHYQQLLFADGYYTTPEGTKSASFREYFKQQSNGNLDIEGQVYGWYTAPKTAKYYGEEIGDSHDTNPQEFIQAITEAAVADGVNLADYDAEDPYDFDGDNDLMEPDGIVDHLMVIHSGNGQEDGGGVLSTDAIWSHSSQVGADPVSVPGSDTKIYSYTIEAENGAVGLFTHEFTHDLGMPDDYDTQYTADGDITEYWSLMSSGSWSGKPAGSMPSGINPYSRVLLGFIHGGDWINYNYMNYEDITPSKLTLDTATMNTGNTQALLISLPKDKNVLPINKPTEGLKEFYGGSGSEIDRSIVTELDLTGKTSVNLTYDIWYNIEENWDGGFVQVSEDGTNWVSLTTPHTTADFNNKSGYPSILDSLPAYTGSSNGWISENIDLSAYANKKIYLRFRYATDWGSELEGMMLDNIIVNADGQKILSEGAENGFGAFTNDSADPADQWQLSDGNKYGSHYYVAEWRSHIGVDEGLKYNARARVEYNQGMLLWYVNTNYGDNWVGVHPGYGQLGVVDSTQYVYLNAGLGNGNESGIRTGYMPFVQLHDAAFSLDKAADMDLSIYSWAKNPNLKGKQAEPLFDDSNSYFSIKSPYSGLKLPTLGLKIKVSGKANDYSRGLIYISK